MLTVEILKNMTSGQIIGTGTGTYPELHSRPVRWVAVRGRGFWDWAIYYHLENNSVEFVRQQGDKCQTESVIKRLVPCDDEAYEMYRR